MDISTKTVPKTAKGEGGFFTRMWRKVKDFVLSVVHGSAATKISCLFMGVGQMMRGQYGKGIIYFLLEVLFVLYMALFGGPYIWHLGDLGTTLGGQEWNDATQAYEYTKGDNSFLILLYGVVSLIVLLLFVAVWFMNVSGNIKNDKLRNIAAKAAPQLFLDTKTKLVQGACSMKLSSRAIAMQGGRVRVYLSGNCEGASVEIDGERVPISELREGDRFGSLQTLIFKGMGQDKKKGTYAEFLRDENIYTKEPPVHCLYLYSENGDLNGAEYLRECGKVSTFKEDCAQLINRKFYALLLALPMLGLLVFTVMPLIFMILIAFTNYDFSHTPPGQLFDWVGMANFSKIFSIGSGGLDFLLVFLRVLVWTFIWAFFATFTNYFFGMILALMINKKGIKLKMFWRTLFVLAIAVPQFVTLLLMNKILDADGILNVILGTKILWLGDSSHWAIIPRITIIVVNMWIGIPYTILMCSGILMNIPAEMYEAAKLDGANPMQMFINIVLPYMLHVTTPYLITQFVGNINNFNVIWLLSGGGPVDNINYGAGAKAQATDLLVTWLYRLTTDVNPQYNLASVIGIIIFVISAALSLITFNRSKATKNEEDYQ